MAILKGIGFALGLIALCAWYYFDNVHPFQPESLFEKLKSQFSNVKSGRISYHYFKQCMSEECTRYMIKDTKEMVKFKRMMAGMLEYDDFIVSAFSDPHLTLDKLYDKMETYSPYAGRPGTEDENEDTIQDAGFADGEEGIPGLFTFGLGLDLMNLMIENKHCEAGSLRWMDELPENTTTLQGVFADAICKTLRLPYRGRYNYLKPIWGEKNFSKYFRNALNLQKSERDVLLGIVRKVISDYEFPEEVEQYKLPGKPYVLAQPPMENNH